MHAGVLDIAITAGACDILLLCLWHYIAFSACDVLGQCVCGTCLCLWFYIPVLVASYFLLLVSCPAAARVTLQHLLLLLLVTLKHLLLLLLLFVTCLLQQP